MRALRRAPGEAELGAASWHAQDGRLLVRVFVVAASTAATIAQDKLCWGKVSACMAGGLQVLPALRQTPQNPNPNPEPYNESELLADSSSCMRQLNFIFLIKKPGAKV